MNSNNKNHDFEDNGGVDEGEGGGGGGGGEEEEGEVGVVGASSSSSSSSSSASSEKDGDGGLFSGGPNQIFPASCNWYCAQIASCNSEGLLAFGARNGIYVLDLSTRRFLKTLGGHTNRVTSVAFSPHLPNICISGSADRTVRVWDVSLGKCLKVFQGGGPQQHKSEIVCISSSSASADLIVSADASGFIQSWRVSFIISYPNNSSLLSVSRLLDEGTL